MFIKQSPIKKSLKLTIEHRGHTKCFLSLKNLGTADKPDFKFTIYHSVGQTFIDVTDSDIDNPTLTKCIEFSYHPDGSYLQKNPSARICEKMRTNPQREGYRRKPLDEIKDIESILFFDIQNLEHLPDVEIKKHQQIITYGDPFLFDNKFIMILSIKRTDYNVFQGIMTNETDMYVKSNVIDNIADNLSLWVYFSLRDMGFQEFQSKKLNRTLSIYNTNRYRMLEDGFNSAILKDNEYLLSCERSV